MISSKVLDSPQLSPKKAPRVANLDNILRQLKPKNVIVPLLSLEVQAEYRTSGSVPPASHVKSKAIRFLTPYKDNTLRSPEASPSSIMPAPSIERLISDKANLGLQSAWRRNIRAISHRRRHSAMVFKPLLHPRPRPPKPLNLGHAHGRLPRHQLRYSNAL